MKTNFSAILALIFLIAVAFFINYCQHKMPVQPNGPCKDNRLVEDTTRIYIHLKVGVDGTVVKVDTLPIYPNILFARFYPWVKDTTEIKQLLEKHNLRVASRGGFYSVQQQLTAYLCMTDDRRAEYHFTPYGKAGFCNFGADSLVEYAFGVFSYGFLTLNGNIVFKFVEGTPQARIDSLFNANGLRLLYTAPDIPTGKLYVTLVTPRSKKNVLDLGYDLQFVPFIVYASVDFGSGGPARCK
jgi:hypothetical protein